MAHVIKTAVLLTGKEQFSPYYGGAVARWTYETYSRLPAWVQPTIFGVPAQRPYEFPFNASGANWLPRLCSWFPYVRRYEDHTYLALLMRRLREFEIIHIQNRVHWARILRQLGFRGKIITHLHNSHLAHYDAKRLDIMAPHIDCVVSCSRYIENTFRSRSESIARRSVVVYNGVNTDLFRASDVPRFPKRIFFVGRINPQKGILPLLQAFEHVLKAHPDAELVIGGATAFGINSETDYVRQLRELALKLNMGPKPKVSFTGYIEHDTQLPQYFQEAAVAVFPSVFEEPFGMVICEAMACGTPVITTRRGGIPEAAGEAALIVDSPDPALLADAIIQLLNDDHLRAELGRRSLLQAAHFDWRNIAEQWARVISAVAKGSDLSRLDAEHVSAS